MKKNILSILSVVILSAAVFTTGCKKDGDTTAPSLTLRGDLKQTVILKSTYTDPGATATDETDGSLTSTINVSGTVNTAQAGTYTLTYSVVDKAGNETSAQRTVVVKVDVTTNLVGTYDVVDVNPYPGGTSYPYQDAITASSTTNRLLVTKFGFYTNGGVHMDLSGDDNTIVTIPSQTVVSGNPSASRTFAGSGTVSKDGNVITVVYTEVTNGTTTTSQETYTRK